MESKHTKGRLEHDQNDIHSRLTINGEAIAAVYQLKRNDTDEEEANAAELVRRWNAFEEGGMVAELVAALEGTLAIMDSYVCPSVPMRKARDAARAVIAKAKGE